jgi:hypothetical protein
MNVTDQIKQALEQKGLPVEKPRQASKSLGVSAELLRLVLVKGYVPKDKTLAHIAARLGMNASALILAAHRERVPAEMKGYFLSAVQERSGRRKRVFPLSEEQCLYLEKVMNPDEIQVVRKLRQVPGEAHVQVMGYVDYMFASKRVPAPADQGAIRMTGE